MFIEGKDIIITDPCYIIKDKEDNPNINPYSIEVMNSPKLKEITETCDTWEKEHPDDWVISFFGEEMALLGLDHSITSHTGYGDWSCATFNTLTKEKLGEFCADAGMVGVFVLEEVLKYNPEFNYHLTKPWTTTWIKNFTGEVDIRSVVYTDSNNEDHEEIRVIGTGSVDFYTTQTGF